jgi:hypothetical protein
MEETVSLSGKFKTKKDFTKTELLNIRNDIILGNPKLWICHKHGITDNVFDKIYGEFSELMATVTAKDPKCILGSKQEAYWTEEEMLRGNPKYSWGELSRTEKQFYLNYGKEFNKVNPGISRRLEPHLRAAYERGEGISFAGENPTVIKIDRRRTRRNKTSNCQ